MSAAHQATPTAEDGEKTPYLFVQSFEGGSIAPKAGEDGTFTVTLNHGLGQTLYFADRPSRDVGAVPTEQFLQGLGFQADNPPNAAIVVDDGNGGTDIAVVELTNPLIDPTVPAVIYDIKVLENWEDTTELGLQEGPADLSNLAESFGADAPLHRRLRRRVHHLRSRHPGHSEHSRNGEHGVLLELGDRVLSAMPGPGGRQLGRRVQQHLWGLQPAVHVPTIERLLGLTVRSVRRRASPHRFALFS